MIDKVPRDISTTKRDNERVYSDCKSNTSHLSLLLRPGPLASLQAMKPQKPLRSKRLFLRLSLKKEEMLIIRQKMRSKKKRAKKGRLKQSQKNLQKVLKPVWPSNGKKQW